MNKRRIFILIGPPGSGKGTQAKLLKDKLKLNHLSTGQVLRNEIRAKTALGRKVAPYLAKGLLVPDEWVVKEVLERLAEHSRLSFILDGFPRNVTQAKTLDNFLKDKGTQNFILEIFIGAKTGFERISGRRDCSCGKIYHVQFNPPKKRGVCDVCGKKLKIRNDAQPEVVRERLRIHRDKTRKMLKFYRESGNYIILQVDGEHTVEAIHKDLLKRIKDRK